MTERHVEYHEAPSAITDHAFVPRGAWYTVCKHCGLAEAAHKFSTIDQLAEIKADHERQNERKKSESRVVIGYYSDDNEDDE